MIYWVLGFIFIIVLAYVIVRLSVNTNDNKDSKLGILQHPSFYKKQEIEMVDDSISDES